MAHTFSPSSTWEFEASLVYRLSFRTARATQKNPVSKKEKKGKKENCLMCGFSKLLVAYLPRFCFQLWALFIGHNCIELSHGSWCIFPFDMERVYI